MSVSRAQQLINKVSEDVVFRQKLTNATEAEKPRILADAGFGDVTKADIQALQQSGSAELSDAELEAVAGGATSTWILVSLAAAALA